MERCSPVPGFEKQSAGYKICRRERRIEITKHGVVMRIRFALLLCLAISGCQSVTQKEEPYFASQIKEISADELHKFWVNKTSGKKMLPGRPSWLPKGSGEWVVQIVIDSKGNEVERLLVESNPVGFMTQDKIDEMPLAMFAPAPSNAERVPVKFLSFARIAPRGK